MIHFDEEKNIYISDGEVFRPASHLAPSIYVSTDGRFIRSGNLKIKTGSRIKSKTRRKLAVIVAVGQYITKRGTKATLTRNIGALVLDAWKGVDPERREVDHIDRDCYNNELSNLRWCNRAEQMLNTRFKYHEDCLAVDPRYDELDAEERKSVRRKVYKKKYHEGISIENLEAEREAERRRRRVPQRPDVRYLH